MRFGSVCSGIEAASVAWNPLGWKAAWFSEIEPFPCELLRQRFPAVPNLGDMTTIAGRIRAGEVEAPDMLCGGTPCQAFSVAGRRQSLSDERGNLSLVFCELADAIDSVRAAAGRKPAVVFWENVPGVLSTKDNAFGCLLGKLAGSDFPLSSGSSRWSNAGFIAGKKRLVAWRILDAQYFGVPQRRRRVFVVASAVGGGVDPSAVLFEREGVRRNFEESRTTGQDITVFAQSGFSQCCESRIGAPVRAAGGDNGHGSENLVLYDFAHRADVMREVSDQSSTLTARMGTGGGNVPCVECLMDHGDNSINVESDKTGTLRAQTHGHEPCIAISGNIIGRQVKNGGNGLGINIDVSPTLTVADQHGVCDESRRIRKLTPIECERLQGFPDDWTKIEWRGKPADECPDAPRYKAIGNSWAVPCVRWIGRRIQNEWEFA